MFGSQDRKRLVKKGLACNKQRRKSTQKEWVRKLESNPWVKPGMVVGFVLVLGLLIFSRAPPEPGKYFLIGLLVFIIALAQLWIKYTETFHKNSRIALVFGVMLLHLCVAKLIMVFCSDPHGALRPEVGVLLIPYALAPLVLSVLLGKNYGIYAAVFVSLWSSILFRGVDAVLLVMSLISGFIAVFVTIQVRRRSRLLRAGFYVGLATWLLAVSFGIISISWLQLPDMDWGMFGKQSLAAILNGLLTGMPGGGPLPLLQSLFHIHLHMVLLGKSRCYPPPPFC